MAPAARQAAAVRTLYLLRHAKSSWGDETLADLDRPLAPRGVAAAPAIAEYMRTASIAPDVVLCSTARRTRETLALLGDALPLRSEVHIEAGLYGASAEALVKRLRRLPPTMASALVIGHNPGLQELALLLARSGAELGDLTRKYPTAALATLEMPLEVWTDVGARSAELIGFVRPRDLAPAG